MMFKGILTLFKLMHTAPINLHLFLCMHFDNKIYLSGKTNSTTFNKVIFHFVHIIFLFPTYTA